MKTKNLIILTLSICLLTTLTNCTEKRSENKTIRQNEQKEEKSNSSDVETDYIEAEESPTFSGGETKLLEFIRTNLDKEIVSDLKLKKGKVVATFQIDTAGQVINLKIIRSYNQAVDSEFIRVLRLMPNWKSGKRLMNGTNGPWVKTKVNMTLPLKIPYKHE
jgi:protein TonB